jgi:hypothetical protein
MGRRTILAAWLYTGPLGHLYGTGADIVELWTRWGLRQLSARFEVPGEQRNAREDRDELAR